MSPRIVLVAALAATSVACTAPTQPRPSTTYILLDPETRQTTTLTADGWTGSPVLPLAVEASGSVTLQGPHGSSLLPLRAGALAHVHDSGATIEWLELGKDAPGDRLLVRGPEDAATELAQRLGAEITPRGDATFRLAADAIFDRTSFMIPSDAIVEALPDVETAAPEPRPRTLPFAAPSLAPNLPESVPSRHDDPLVGVYASKNQLLFLDASGGFSLEDPCGTSTTTQGRYYLAEGHVVLLGEGEPMLLERHADDFPGADGSLFTLLLPGEGKSRGER